VGRREQRDSLGARFGVVGARSVCWLEMEGVVGVAKEGVSEKRRRAGMISCTRYFCV